MPTNDDFDAIPEPSPQTPQSGADYNDQVCRWCDEPRLQCQCSVDINNTSELAEFHARFRARTDDDEPYNVYDDAGNEDDDCDSSGEYDSDNDDDY